MIDSPFPVNPACFTIHSCIPAAREDAGCVLHTHSRAGVAVSAQKCGVLPTASRAPSCSRRCAYHEYEGVALRDDERPRLQAGGELAHVNPKIMEDMAQVMKTVTAGQGANIAWPALIRKLDRLDQASETRSKDLYSLLAKFGRKELLQLYRK